MNQLSKVALTAGLAGVVLLCSATLARADDVPSFKKAKDKETEAFCKSVYESIIKGTRTAPKEVTLTKYSYAVVKGKDGRKTLTLDGYYKGNITKIKFTEKWTLSLDTSDPKEWEVLKMEYKTDHKVKPKQSHIQELVKKFNK